MKYYIKNGNCGTEYIFKVIGSKWRPQIIAFCNAMGNVSYSFLKKNIPDITDTSLSRQLAGLTQEGMLEKDNNGNYFLTEKGIALLPAMTMMLTLATKCNYQQNYSSAIEFVNKLIGSKWKSRIIWILFHAENIRFNALQNSIEGLSHKILNEQLQDLLRYNLIEKIIFEEKEPHVEYRLTENGKIAYQIIDLCAEWCLTQKIINPTVTIEY